MGFIADRRMNPAGWGSIKSFQDYKDQFKIENNLNVADNYESSKQYFYDLAHSAQYSKLTEELNFEQRMSAGGRQLKGVSAKLDQQIDIWINQIRTAKITEYKFKVQNGTTQINQTTAQNLVAKWQGVLNLIKTQNWSNLNTELKTLETYINQLNASIKNSNSGDLIDLQNILGEGDAYTLASRLEGLLSRIQGEVLEQEVKKFLARKIPTQVAVTGSVTIEGGGKIKPDLVAMLLDTLELKNENGQTTYVFKNGEIYDAEGNPATDSVSLSEYELQTLMENTIGFSAKTTSGATTFHQGYNIDRLIQDSLNQGSPQAAVWQLLHFYQLGLQDVPNIDAYQRYAVSRLATQILGKNNVYIITKNEIIPTYQYVEKLTRKGLYFANKKVPYKNGNSLNNNFGNTNILGPKV